MLNPIVLINITILYHRAIKMIEHLTKKKNKKRSTLLTTFYVLLNINHKSNFIFSKIFNQKHKKSVDEAIKSPQKK